MENFGREQHYYGISSAAQAAEEKRAVPSTGSGTAYDIFNLKELHSK
ncbi:MAG: hypothetical protein IKR71_07780 [Bacteroidales bacterium]|nr:hypothetical protein [Bacteroidales bacterium]